MIVRVSKLIFSKGALKNEEKYRQRIRNAIHYAHRRELYRAIPAYEEATGIVNAPNHFITTLKTMKLHLPKTLLVAVLAVVTLGQHSAWGAITPVDGTPVDGVTPCTVTFTNNSQNINLGNYVDSDSKKYTLVFTLDGNGNNFFLNGSCSTDVDIQIGSTSSNGLYINNGYSGGTDNYKSYEFGGAVTGSGVFNAASSSRDVGYFNYIFTGDMSGYTGNMIISGQSKNNKLTFSGNTSGTGTITGIGKGEVVVDGATMKNSSINTTNLTVSGESSFAGDVTATRLTLGAGADVSFAAGKTLTLVDAISGTTGSLTFGEDAKIVLTKVKRPTTLEHSTFGYRTDDIDVDVLAGELTLSDTSSDVVVEFRGSSATMDRNGVVTGLQDSEYYISGAAKSSDILASGDDISASSSVEIFASDSALTVDNDITLPRLNATLGTISLTEDLTVTGASSITGTEVSGAGNLIVADGATLQVNSTARNLKSNIRINAGGTMQFLGTGADAIEYIQTNRTIYVDGTMDVGNTRQTVGNWKFELTGGTVQGAGQSTQNNTGLDFHTAGSITAKALESATVQAPTKSTISTIIRYKGQLSLNVEENARLDITAKMIKNSGTLAIDVAEGGVLNIRRKDADTITLDTVNLDGGSLFRQGTTGHYTTNITSLTVGTNGATIGTSYDSIYGHSYQATLVIGTLSGTGDLIATSSSNTSIATTIRINGGSDYSGTVKVQNWEATGSNRRTDLDIASDTALAGAVIELGGGTNDSANHTTNVVLGSSAVTVKGIKDADARKSKGDVIIRPATGNAAVVPSTLTLAGDGTYSTKSGIGANISLKKTGTGKQSFGGDVSNFKGSITVADGTLEFLKEATALNVTQLSISGGNLSVNGSIKTSEAFTYKGGSIQADLNLQTGTVLTLNGAAELDNNKLTLGVGLTLKGDLLGSLKGITGDRTVALFTGVSALTLGENTYEMGDVLDATSGIDLSKYFTLADAQTPAVLSDEQLSSGYYLGFDANGTLYAGLIPEPTTATLSLLALAGLAARRRRK